MSGDLGLRKRWSLESFKRERDMEESFLCQWSVIRSLLAILQWWGFNVTVIVMNKWIFQVSFFLFIPNELFASWVFLIMLFFLLENNKNKNSFLLLFYHFFFRFVMEFLKLFLNSALNLAPFRLKLW